MLCYYLVMKKSKKMIEHERQQKILRENLKDEVGGEILNEVMGQCVNCSDSSFIKTWGILLVTKDKLVYKSFPRRAGISGIVAMFDKSKRAKIAETPKKMFDFSEIESAEIKVNSSLFGRLLNESPIIHIDLKKECKDSFFKFEIFRGDTPIFHEMKKIITGS